MNLSPDWVAEFKKAGIQAAHWSSMGRPDAADSEILERASTEGWVVFTHDLDFGTILATRGWATPSVIQLRGQEVTPSAVGRVVFSVVWDFEAELRQGALITVDPSRTRARILPLR